MKVTIELGINDMQDLDDLMDVFNKLKDKLETREDGV